MPKIIAIEGCDGAGKTTLAQQLVDELSNDGLKVKYYQHPGHGDVGETIRSLFKSQRLPVTAQIHLLLANQMATIKAIHDDNVDIAVVDRWIVSTAIYQSLMLNANPDVSIWDSELTQSLQQLIDLIAKTENDSRWLLKQEYELPSEIYNYHVFIAHTDWSVIQSRLSMKKKDWIESLPENYMNAVHTVFSPVNDNGQSRSLISNTIFQTQGKFLGYVDTSKPVDLPSVKGVLADHGILESPSR